MASTGEPECALIVLDEQGRIEWANEIFAGMSGCSAHAIIGARPEQVFLPPGTAPEAIAQLRRLLESGEKFRFETLLTRERDGSRRLAYEVQAIIGTDGRAARRIAIGRDVTEHQQAEQALRDSERRLRAIIEMTPECVKLVAADGTLLEMNAAGLAMVGVEEASAVVGRCVYSLIAPEHRRAYEEFNEQVCSGVPGSLEFEMIGLQGSRRWMETRAVPMDNPSDGSRVQLAVTRDITERRRTEEALREVDRAGEKALQAALDAARMKSEFLANTSHEIRTPLNGILGMTELVLETDLTAEQRDFVQTIKTSSDALLTILNDVLDFSKIEAGKLELESIPFALRSTLRDTLKTLALQAHRKGLELVCQVPPDVPDAVVGDPGRLRQILVNLVGNALKFTESGDVSVGVFRQAMSGASVDLHIEVSDTGIGIPRSKQDVIFKAFAQADGSTTRKYGGTGLGLAIVSQLVEMMGGRIWLDSEVGKGSTFHVTLRLSLDTKARAAPVLAQREKMRGLHALIVDDNDTNRRILAEMLRGWGMRPQTADGSMAALSALDQAHGRNDPFSLVLLDVQMPVMDGFELAERIQADSRWLGAKLILLTSSGLRGDAARCRDLGVAGYLTKPIMASDLLEAVQAVLGPATAPSVQSLVTRHFLRDTRARLRILLAEDNPVNRKVAGRILERQGHSVQEVVDGRAVLAALQRERFDLVLLDVQMPGKGGLETAAEIRELERTSGGHLPIIALTAHALPGDRERFLAAGMDGYVSKPIDAGLLFTEIERFAPRPPADAAPAMASVGSLASVLDRDALLARVEGDLGQLSEIVELFLEDGTKLRAEIRASLVLADAGRIERAAHRLRGALGTLTARAAELVAERIETAARCGDLASIEHLLPWLEREMDRLEPELIAFSKGETLR